MGLSIEELGESKLVATTEEGNNYQVFGKITDLLITENKTILTLDRPESGIKEIEAPLAENSMKFTLDKDTQITDGAQDLDLSDLKIGQHIRVMYVEKGLGRRIAQGIVLHSNIISHLKNQ
jgi:hypothetical protein